MRRPLMSLFAVVLTIPLGLAMVGGGSSVAAQPRTSKVVLRPVHADGTPAAHWQVRRETGYSVSCVGPAPSAVSWGIVGCYPTAAYLPACWKSTNHTVLCLRDVTRRELVRVRYAGSLHRAPAQSRPAPMALKLANGDRCTARVGGAWGVLPARPSWIGFYSCPTWSVYGRPNSDGINRAHPLWSVALWNGTSRDITLHSGVAVAYYVGTAR